MNPYESHLPVLRELRETIPMRRVLELGCGRYSTPFFCDVANVVVSLETDPRWAIDTTERCKCDTLDMRVVADIPSALPLLDSFDLVFIDNGGTTEDRVEAIRAVLGQPHPAVIVHDAEVFEYREVLRELADRFITYTEHKPWTAVAW